MSSLSGPEILPHSDDLSADHMSANVVDLQKFRENFREVSADVDQAESHNESSEPVHVYFTDWQKIETVRRDPLAFEALVEEYMGFIKFKANEYFLPGGDYEDLVQEALFGFYKGVRDYDGTSSSFNSFAELCMTRQLITAIKTATRFKHEPLNQYVSFAHTPADKNGEKGGMTLGEMLPDSSRSPEDIVISTESLKSIVELLLSGLSYTEYSALKMYLEGESYETMAEELGEDTKAIDNALQRVKRKMSERLGIDP